VTCGYERCYDPGPNFSFYTPANYIPLAPPALAPAAPILPPPVYHATPPAHYVSTSAQPPVQPLSVHPLELAPEPLLDDANNLHTSGTPHDIDMEDSIEDN
jgi:hypothetical protein